MGSADLATATQHLRKIYWWLLVGKTLPEHRFGSMFADSGHGRNLAAHLPGPGGGFAIGAGGVSGKHGSWSDVGSVVGVVWAWGVAESGAIAVGLSLIA